MNYPTYDKSLASLAREIEEWERRNFGDEKQCSAELSALGLAEEVGEVCRALIKRAQGIRGTHEEWTEEIRKEIGDVFIKVVDVAWRAGINPAEAIEDRWDVIRQRDWVADRQGHGIGGEQS